MATSTWKGDTAIEHCWDADALLRFIRRRILQVHEEGGGTPDEIAEYNDAVARLIELCNLGQMPAQWKRVHLQCLAAAVKK